jgi:GNAT superfamily N-acetyltransferase
MSSVSHLRKRLDAPPATFELSGIVVRNIEVTADVDAWLKLRHRTIAWLKPAARTWTADDFQAEMVDKPWWQAERTWLAIADEAGESRLVGSVTLAVRQTSSETIPVVHWLLVDPVYRRRGIGRLLISHLEQAVWTAGWREVQLETHVRWAAAAAFYHSIGYEPLRDPSPR